MVQDKTPNYSVTIITPVSYGSRLTNGLIRLRELILNHKASANNSMVINGECEEGSLSPTADLAGELKKTITDLMHSVISADGSTVDYAALRTSEAYAGYWQARLAALRDFNPTKLSSLKAARAFWINLYNTLILDAVIYFGIEESNSEAVIGGRAFFRKAAYLVGGQRLSLEDIEHGILRGNQGNPYVPWVHFSNGDRRLGWALPLDPRIHFALNCGGRSCPPIQAYETEKLEQQLDLATKGFLDSTVKVDLENKEVVLSKLFSWYSTDFGGREGIKRFLSDYLPDEGQRQALLSMGDDFIVRYDNYDWRLNARL
ncbi:MAG: DUF547 domain-containing protein [Candidatus Promineifilaceae bacterium]